MAIPVEGQTSFAILKAASVVVAIGASVLAIAVWASSNEPRLTFDVFGEVTISEETSAVKIITGIAILLGGWVQAALFWQLVRSGTMSLRFGPSSQVPCHPKDPVKRHRSKGSFLQEVPPLSCG